MPDQIKAKKAFLEKYKNENKYSDLLKERYCSFCNKGSSEAKGLIAGPNNVFICDECVELASDHFKSIENIQM